MHHDIFPAIRTCSGSAVRIRRGVLLAIIEQMIDWTSDGWPDFYFWMRGEKRGAQWVGEEGFSQSEHMSQGRDKGGGETRREAFPGDSRGTPSNLLAQ